MESVEEIRRAVSGAQSGIVWDAPTPPPQPPAPMRTATRMESAEEIRRAMADAKPPIVAATIPFRPVHRSPLAVLTICDDGKIDGEQLRLRNDRTVIGRAEGDVRIPHDAMMSSRHAEIVREADQVGWRWTLDDLRSTNGTYVRVASAPLEHGTEFLVGSSVLRFEDATLNLPGATPPAGGALSTKTQGWQTLAATDLKPSLIQVLKEGVGKRFFLDAAEQWIGRDANQAIALVDDVQVDARHAKVVKDAKGNWSIADAGSLNHVWLRIERHAIEGSCEFQLGEQRFVVRIGP